MYKWAPVEDRILKEYIDVPIVDKVIGAVDTTTLILWIVVAVCCMSMWIWLYIQLEEDYVEIVEAEIVIDKINLSLPAHSVCNS